MKRIFCMLALVLASAMVAQAQVAQVFTEAATSQSDPSCAAYYYSGSFVATDSTKYYYTPEFDISEAARSYVSGTSVVYPIAWIQAVSSEVGTETVDIIPEFSLNGSTWVAASDSVVENMGTTLVTDTLNVIAGVKLPGYNWGRWMRLKFIPAGSNDKATLTYRIVVPKAVGAGCGARAAVKSNA